MQAIAATARPGVAVTAPRRAPAARPLRAAPRPSLVGRTRWAADDVGKYLSEAASQIFHPQADNVPWQAGAQPFAGRIVHHEQASRLRALESAVEAAAQEIRGSMDEAPEDAPEEATTYKFDEHGNLVGQEGTLGEFVHTSIQRVFNNNFKGDASEPKNWVSTGYAARPRSQRTLRREYERLQRFRTVVAQIRQQADQGKKELEPITRDV